MGDAAGEQAPGQEEPPQQLKMGGRSPEQKAARKELDESIIDAAMTLREELDGVKEVIEQMRKQFLEKTESSRLVSSIPEHDAEDQEQQDESRTSKATASKRKTKTKK